MAFVEIQFCELAASVDNLGQFESSPRVLRGYWRQGVQPDHRVNSSAKIRLPDVQRMELPDSSSRK